MEFQFAGVAVMGWDGRGPATTVTGAAVGTRLGRGMKAVAPCREPRQPSEPCQVAFQPLTPL